MHHQGQPRGSGKPQKSLLSRQATPTTGVCGLRVAHCDDPHMDQDTGLQRHRARGASLQLQTLASANLEHSHQFRFMLLLFLARIVPNSECLRTI